jgi:hypothetical protein
MTNLTILPPGKTVHILDSQAKTESWTPSATHLQTPSALPTPSDSIYSCNGYNSGSSSTPFGFIGPGFGPYTTPPPSSEPQETYLDDYTISPRPTLNASSKSSGKALSGRRPSNRDEFDGPHQFLQKPPQEYISQQDRELPVLPTHLNASEQDFALNKVNDCLSQYAFNFVAKY